MPFTPIHFGPGAAIKAVAPQHFSFTIFCFAQVVTDCETAFYMLRGEYPFHRFCHTFVGATLVAAGSVIVGRPVCEFALRVWAAWRHAPFRRFIPTTSISLRAAAVGAFVGTYSHVVLDGIMHDDVAPFAPFSTANPFHGILTPMALNAFCLLFGVFGLLVAERRTRSV